MANHAVRLIAPVLLGAFILLFPADGLRALGLGEARVDSWLGQPLDVSIRLLEVEAEAIESVSVGPASLEDFERLGVPSQSLGLGLEVTVDRRSQPPVVRVRSQRPVNDPIVQILIDARWSNGRVLREYTLFLDPPVMDSAAPVREVSQPSEAPSREPAPAPAEREPAERQPSEPARPTPAPEQPAEAEPEPAPASRGADSVAVSRGDTLWSLAQDWRPDSSLSMDQVMLAIFNRNRDAFLGENINRLRSDALLDMPGIDEVQSVDRAEAERRVREHMRSWQPAVTEDVPVVSDAAMPGAPAQQEEAAREPDAETAEGEEDFRLDVVPPEEDQYSESSAVAEGDIRQVRDELAGLEEEIEAEGLESEAFDEHVAEIRDALEQRDMAGLAVAQESLAELETRLREAREARAEQERLAQAADGEQATDSEEGDQIADYMRELEEEFGTQDGDEVGDAAGDEGLATTDDGAAREQEGIDAGEASEEEADPMAAADEPAADAEAADQDAGAQQEESDRPMPVTTTSGGMPGWLWLVVVLLVLVLVAGAGLLWVRRRREAAEPGEPSLAAADAVDSARAAVARRPGDLAAHLALLKLLADQGREQEFTDAFDQMYQEVDDESAPQWQEALSLAAAHVPDHPLLTPHETSLDEDDDFERRADDMLGMLDVDESGEEADSDQDDDFDEVSEEADTGPREDDTFNLSLESEESESSPQQRERTAEDADEEESFDADMDLAVLSERLDDPSSEPGRDKSLEGESEDADFDEFEELDEYSMDEVTGEEPDEHSEAPVDLEKESSPEPDLDLDPSREQEADEVFGEAGTRETEDLDLDLSSEVEDVDATDADGGLDFDLGDAAEPEPEAGEPGDAAEALGESEASESQESEKEEQPAAGGSLSDEDADVKLDLARAYISVDLADSARTVLEEVVSDGSEAKRAEAQKLLDDIE